MGTDSFGINTSVVQSFANQIKKVVNSGLQICIVVGGGNIYRGVSISNNGIIYHEPNPAQGAIRFINGDAREDLHNLYCPILKAIEWYPNTDSNYLEIYSEGGYAEIDTKIWSLAVS